MDLRARLYGPANRLLPPSFFEKRFARQAQDDYRRAGVSFIHVPRTAGLSVIRAIYGSQNLRHFTIERFLEVSADDVRRLPRFAIVRNPWDRAVSAYELAKLGGLPGGAQMLHPERYRGPEFATFDSFVRDYLAVQNVWKIDGVFRPQVYYLGGRHPDTRLLDHIGRFDRLGETEAWLSDTLDRDITLLHTNQTARGSYQDCYTPTTREIVGRMYSDDIERFGFEFES